MFYVNDKKETQTGNKGLKSAGFVGGDVCFSFLDISLKLRNYKG